VHAPVLLLQRASLSSAEGPYYDVVHRCSYAAWVQDRQPTRASKYASMLIMTGADPAAANQAAALRHLREFVHRHR
jgi:ribosomal protein L4